MRVVRVRPGQGQGMKDYTIQEFFRDNKSQIASFVKRVQNLASRELGANMPPIILVYGLQKYGAQGWCEGHDGEDEIVFADIFSDNLTVTICHEYAHLIGYNEIGAEHLADELYKYIQEQNYAS